MLISSLDSTTLIKYERVSATWDVVKINLYRKFREFLGKCMHCSGFLIFTSQVDPLLAKIRIADWENPSSRHSLVESQQ